MLICAFFIFPYERLDDYVYYDKNSRDGSK